MSQDQVALNPASLHEVFLATAHHEAGHAVFYLRHCGFVNGICIDPNDPREGRVGGGVQMGMRKGHDYFAAGGDEWHAWRRRAFCRAAECLAGPMAELQASNRPIPRDFCDECCFDPYFVHDITDATSVVCEWYRAAKGILDEVYDEWYVSDQLSKVAAYVQTSLRNRQIRRAIHEIVDLIIAQNGCVSGEQLIGIRLPAVRLRKYHLDFP